MKKQTAKEKNYYILEDTNWNWRAVRTGWSWRGFFWYITIWKRPIFRWLVGLAIVSLLITFAMRFSDLPKAIAISASVLIIIAILANTLMGLTWNMGIVEALKGNGWSFVGTVQAKSEEEAEADILPPPATDSPGE